MGEQGGTRNSQRRLGSTVEGTPKVGIRAGIG
jgi:hypothetical protein